MSEPMVYDNQGRRIDPMSPDRVRELAATEAIATALTTLVPLVERGVVALEAIAGWPVSAAKVPPEGPGSPRGAVKV